MAATDVGDVTHLDRIAGALNGYRPRFARPGNDDLSANGEQTAENWAKVTEPYRSAWDVWGRAVNGAMGQGPGVYDDEIIPAGRTLASAAMTGSMPMARPWGSLGAGAARWMKDDLSHIAESRAAGLGDKQIAHQMGTTDAAIRGAARYHDLGPSLTRGNPEVRSSIRDMWSSGSTIPEIAAATGMQPRSVQRLARTLGLPPRRPGRPRSTE